MHQELANQDIARLRYAEVLREVSRRPLVDTTVDTRSTQNGLLEFVKRLLRQPDLRAEPLGSGAQ